MQDIHVVLMMMMEQVRFDDDDEEEEEEVEEEVEEEGEEDYLPHIFSDKLPLVDSDECVTYPTGGRGKCTFDISRMRHIQSAIASLFIFLRNLRKRLMWCFTFNHMRQ